MRSTNLEYFRFAVEAGSLTRAAWLHGVRVSTMTRAIDNLEDELGVTLLERTHSGIRLTAAGDVLFHRISSLLDDWDEIRALSQILGTGRRGVIRIGSLLPLVGQRIRLALSAWRKKHPDIRVAFHEMGDLDLQSALFRHRVDVIFFTPFIQSDYLESLPFCIENLMLAMPSEHPLRQYESVTRKELQNETFLLQDWGGDYSVRRRYLEILGSNITLESHPAGKQSVFALVGSGYGMTLAVQSQAEQGFPGVIFRPLRERNTQLQICLGWDANNQDTVTGRFVAFVRDLVPDDRREDVLPRKRLDRQP
ncbi:MULTISPECIES: LysR family transcriptional regulator [Gluconobacter]|uniref:LysR substrate-binding domain-containing protein n=1 Tax=Gluconobacter TaxID=441 RepID=UPI00188BDAD6|nr:MULTISPECIES: LysR family transcriptional regulator [unclassified Gluconobacter]MBF0851733.1 LysR family transcriptional regulator [Gluconobacter sp. R75690]MBF0880446.1 LysR family transcriptional regulator [Gluconobacter sp. R75828]